MKKLYAIALTLILIFCLSPMSVFATETGDSEGSYGTMQVEYRYKEGESPNIQQQITQFGRVYHLVSTSGPVLESTLPTTRTYSYRIEGALTQAQIDSIKGLGNIKLTPMNVVYERKVDVEIVFPNPDRPDSVLTNDVDDIPRTWPCRVTSGTDQSGYEVKNLDRIGVEYALATPPLDADGLPSGYVATVVYRGVETYAKVGYYYADATFMTTEEEDGVAVYVVVAEYQSEEIPPQVSEITPVPESDDVLPPPAPVEDEVTNMLDNQGSNPFTNILDGNVPLGYPGITGVWSFLSLLFSLAALIIVLILAMGAAAKWRRVGNLSKIGIYGDENWLATIRRRGIVLRILTILFGILTFVVWLYLDDFDLGMVWISSSTVLVGVLFALTIVLSVLTNLRNMKTTSEDADEEEFSEMIAEKF